MIVYLQLSPEQALERIKKRSRDCESNIPIEYLKNLESSYETVLDKLSKHTKIVVVDARPD